MLSALATQQHPGSPDTMTPTVTTKPHRAMQTMDQGGVKLAPTGLPLHDLPGGPWTDRRHGVTGLQHTVTKVQGWRSCPRDR